MIKKLLIAATVLAFALPLSATAMHVATGTYTGSGSSQSITGIGFSPSVVIVKRMDVINNVVFSTSVMATGKSGNFSGNSVFSNAISSLDSGGFTVISNIGVNASGGTYYWQAFGDDGSTDIHVGTYTGDGTSGRSITGVGFQPDWVLEAPNGSGSAVYRRSFDTGSNSTVVISGANSTTGITAFGSDGFTVGVTSNGNTVPYYYIAMKSSLTHFQQGTYTGNGAASQSITGIGFLPSFMMVNGVSTKGVGANTQSVTISFPWDGTATSTNSITVLGSDGFTVGSNASVNTNGTVYGWGAWKADPASGFINGLRWFIQWLW
jgi:hypothetical protein